MRIKRMVCLILVALMFVSSLTLVTGCADGRQSVKSVVSGSNIDLFTNTTRTIDGVKHNVIKMTPVEMRLVGRFNAASSTMSAVITYSCVFEGDDEKTEKVETLSDFIEDIKQTVYVTNESLCKKEYEKDVAQLVYYASYTSKAISGEKGKYDVKVKLYAPDINKFSSTYISLKTVTDYLAGDSKKAGEGSVNLLHDKSGNTVGLRKTEKPDETYVLYLYMTKDVDFSIHLEDGELLACYSDQTGKDGSFTDVFERNTISFSNTKSKSLVVFVNTPVVPAWAWIIGACILGVLIMAILIRVAIDAKRGKKGS